MVSLALAVGFSAAPSPLAVEGAEASRSLVSVGKPVTPYRAGNPATGWIDARATDPDGGRALALLHHSYGERNCVEAGRERQLRAYPVREGGSCYVANPGRDAEPWAASLTSGLRAPVVISGRTLAAVEQLTVSGPGGTFRVPRSRHGGFLIVYSRHAAGTATLTAKLHDGTTRSRQFELPPTFDPPGAVVAADPLGLPAWRVAAHLRRSGARAGQSCAEVGQRTDPKTGRGGALEETVCGDLRAAPLVADIAQAGPSRGREASSGDAADRRLVVWGAVSEQVEAVAALGPDGRRELPLAPAGRAFLSIYGPKVGAHQVTLEIRLVDGSVRRYRTLRRLNAVMLEEPSLGVIPPIDAVTLSRDPLKVALTATLTRPADRLQAMFQGRQVRMRPLAGDRARWRGIYRVSGSRRRGLVIGRRYSLTVVVCGRGRCLRRLVRVRARGAP